jgi:hypothetical protein
MIFNNIENLKSKNKELNKQIETLDKERTTFVTKNYIEKTRELYFKIMELTTNEYQLYQYMGNNAPCTAPLLYIKYGFTPDYSPF